MTFPNLGERLFMDTDRADITFVVDNEAIPGHRLVFAKTCDYFEKLLYGDFKESKSNRIQISGTSAKVFKEVMRFVYLGRLEIADWKLQDLLSLLSLAHEYQLALVVSETVKVLELKPLDFDSWTSVNSAATIYKLKGLKKKCASFAKTKLDDFLCHRNLEKFTPELVCCIFDLSEISTCNQDQLLGSLLKWNKNYRSDKVIPLFQNICWQNVSHNVLAVLAKDYFSSLKTYDECKIQKKLLDEIKLSFRNVIRIENVALSRNESVVTHLEKYQCSLITCLIEDRIAFRFKKNDSQFPIPVRKIEFQSPTYYSPYRAYGLTQALQESEMAFTEPIPDKDSFKYSAAFSESTRVVSFAIYSTHFLNMPFIRLQNLVID